MEVLSMPQVRLLTTNSRCALPMLTPGFKVQVKDDDWGPREVHVRNRA
jgi:hypothetical protein